MKKLKKLLINPEKVIKNEELVNLRGGDYGDPGTCGWDGGGFTQPYCGYSKDTVIWWSTNYGGNWCCDSCWCTDYCGDGSC